MVHSVFGPRYRYGGKVSGFPDARNVIPLFFGLYIKQLFVDRRKMDLESEKTEKLEAEFNRLIERRAKEAARDEEHRTVEEELERRSKARQLRRQREIRLGWIEYEGHMNRLHLEIAAEHADRRSRLMLEAGYEPDESRGPEEAA
jgi:hypothetical protein